MSFVMFDKKDMDIICPKCKRVVIKADSRDHHTKHIACKRCSVLVCYTPILEEVYTRPIPIRETSSGKRFY